MSTILDKAGRGRATHEVNDTAFNDALAKYRGAETPEERRKFAESVLSHATAIGIDLQKSFGTGTVKKLKEAAGIPLKEEPGADKA